MSRSRDGGDPWLKPEPTAVARPSWAAGGETLNVRPWLPGAPPAPARPAPAAGPPAASRPPAPVEPAPPAPPPEPRPPEPPAEPRHSLTDADLDALREDILAEARGPYLEAAATLAATVRELTRQLHEDTVDLALRLASILVQREVALDRTLVLETARRALRLAGPVTRVTVKCATEDAPYLREHLDAVAREESGQAVEVIVRPADDVDLGGCLVTFDRGVVDARLSRQLERLGDAVKAALADAAHEVAAPPAAPPDDEEGDTP